MRITQEQIDQYVQQGFLIVSDLVSPDDLEQLKADAVHIARGGYECPSLQPLPQDATDQQVLETILCIHQPHHISPVMLKYVKHPGICQVLGRITAAHLPWWDGAVKCMQSMLFIKPPAFQGQAWHQDEIHIPTRDRSLIGAWIAIDDATVANGCLWVLPGSHRTGYLYPQQDHDNPDEFDEGGESHGFDDAGEIPVEVKAGSLLFFNGYLLHRSKKNRSDIYRRVLVSHYMNAWSLLPWRCADPATNESAARADDRRVVPVSGDDPYAWKGYEALPNDVFLRSCKANQPT